MIDPSGLKNRPAIIGRPRSRRFNQALLGVIAVGSEPLMDQASEVRSEGVTGQPEASHANDIGAGVVSVEIAACEVSLRPVEHAHDDPGIPAVGLCHSLAQRQLRYSDVEQCQLEGGYVALLPSAQVGR